MPAQGEPTVTLLLRHGQTPLSVQKRYAGASDVPLTDTGVDQAAAAAKRLASAGIGAIVSSPLQRAVRTAEEVASVTGVPVVTDEGFRETDFGAWEGLTFVEVRERWPAEMTSWLADPAVAPPGGDSSNAVNTRVAEAASRPRRCPGCWQARRARTFSSSATSRRSRPWSPRPCSPRRPLSTGCTWTLPPCAKSTGTPPAPPCSALSTTPRICTTKPLHH